ncbi:MAG: DNA polymerase I [Candidatus Hydrogenedentota bacterium]
MSQIKNVDKVKAVGIIDGHSILYRSFYAIPEMTAPNGTPTNAVYGCIRYLLSIINEEKIKNLIWVLDSKEPTFRSLSYADYKAQRQPTPENLSLQIPILVELLEAMGVPVVTKPGYEADDVIATLSKHFSFLYPVIIFSNDKDISQLIAPNVLVAVKKKDDKFHRYLDSDGASLEFGVPPSKIVDLLGLSGDPSDNIPGVPGIGIKTAEKLLTKYKDLEDIYEQIDSIEPERLKNILKLHKESAFKSRELVSLQFDVPLDFKQISFKKEADKTKLVYLLQTLGFKSIITELGLPSSPVKKEIKFVLINNETDLNKLAQTLSQSNQYYLYITGSDPHFIYSSITGIGIAGDDKKIYIIHAPATGSLFEDLKEASIIEFLSTIINSKKSIISYNAKLVIGLFIKHNIELPVIKDDILLQSYLLRPGEGTYPLNRLKGEYLGVLDMPDIPSPDNKDFPSVLACYVNTIIELQPLLVSKLKTERLTKLYYEIELPLCYCLAFMEYYGVKIDIFKLKDLSLELSKELSSLTKDIYRLSNEQFNINSSKQLAIILFEKLKLPPVKKTKTGYSTDSDVLQILSRDFEIARLLLKYRLLSKLKSTYIDALPLLINKSTNRIHTIFHQTGTITGRLSSSDPNLQNIPVRTEESERIRESFISEKDHLFISADYSQIELRIFAHLSKSKPLIKAFLDDRDIHSETASILFDTSIDKINDNMRRVAKTVNFGLLYGMSAFSLAKDLSISQKEAQRFIVKYFENIKGVKEFIDELIKQAKEKGYAETITGRKRYLPELSSRNFSVRSFGERAAINMPIQGSAADIIKMAMINIQKKLTSLKLKTKMILQVHDELLFETPVLEKDKTIKIIRTEMENVMKLDIPLKVDIGCGKSWREAHL